MDLIDQKPAESNARSFRKMAYDCIQYTAVITAETLHNITVSSTQLRRTSNNIAITVSDKLIQT